MWRERKPRKGIPDPTQPQALRRKRRRGKRAQQNSLEPPTFAELLEEEFKAAVSGLVACHTELVGCVWC